MTRSSPTLLETGHTSSPFLRVLRWMPAVAMMALIFYLSSQPSLGDQDYLARRLAAWLGNPAWLDHWLPLIAAADYLSSRVAHPTEYALLAAAFAFALQRPDRPARRTLHLAWGFAFAYSLLDELHQAFVPNRSPSLNDLLLDWAGAALGLWLYSKRPWRHSPVSQVRHDIT